jgi:Kef-type K+ transport system membrane component KefB
MFLIFTGTAALATLALFTKQSLLVAYIALGIIIGPWGLAWVKDTSFINEIGNIGILFLLFLLGLHLHPQNLLQSLSKMSKVTIVSSILLLALGLGIGYLFAMNFKNSLLIGLSMMFSSTIICLKLLPTSILNHQYTGELAVSILLLQDIIAILALLAIKILACQHFSFNDIGLIISGLPLMLIAAIVGERYLLSPLIYRFDRIQEYIFIISIGWCLAMTVLSTKLGLPNEIGAFIAGVALATHPISLYIAENLKPLRDFFLVIFFFTIGASFDLSYLQQIIVPAIILSGAILILKPWIFYYLLCHSGADRKQSWEIAIRLGQSSEFSLLLASLATTEHLILPKTFYLVESTTIITFVASCYWVTIKYPTPMASANKCHKN